MAEFDNTNRITLFHNDKQGKESRPDLTGRLNVEGVEYSVSVWTKESKNGQEFFSGQIQLRDKDAKPSPRNNAKAVEPAGDDFDSEIPF